MKNDKLQNDDQVLELELEQLEDRTLLSAVSIYAAGATNQETIQLKIDDAVVQTWENLGGNADSGEFVKLTYIAKEGVTSDRIKIEFTNDRYAPENGIDRNVRIDKLSVDGKDYQAEATGVFSTGTWKQEDGIQPGFRNSEYLHANGYFQFSNDHGTGSIIEIAFRGNTGEEEFLSGSRG